MKTLEEIKQWLVQHKSVLQEQYKVRELGSFGLPVSPAIAEAAAQLRATQNLRTPDAIQIG